MTVLDHLFVVTFAIAYPVAGVIGFRRLLARIDAGVPIDRIQLYRNTMLGHWALLALCLVVWASASRSWQSLGLGLRTDMPFVIAAVLTLLGIAALIAQLTSIQRADQATIDRLGERFGRLSLLVPQNGTELARFYLVSLTAGIVEEILWRGFLIWYLEQMMPLWAAAVIGTVGFGLAHGYQGADHIPRILAVGAVFVLLYLLTGSVWLPVILHIAVDALQGRLAYEIASRRTTGDQPVNS